MAQTEKQDKKKKKPSFFQWLFVIIIPLLFALLITFIILSLLGIDVVNNSKEIVSGIPFVGNLVTTEEEAELERIEERYQQQIETKDLKISELEAEVTGYELEIDQLNQEIVLLTRQLDDINEELEHSTQINENLERLTISYQEMPPQSAANILSNLNEAVAVVILQELDDQHRGAILSVMDPESAAELTELLLD